MINRRDFLRISGFSALIGLAGIGMTGFKKGSLDAGSFGKDPKDLIAKRWAMVIDMKKFKTEEDIKKCINACHKAHNVPTITENTVRHEVKWLWTDTFEHVFTEQEDKFLSQYYKQMPFLVTCNHCDNPPCVRVCPTKATFKRKEDGIVMMDMHRCIGCRFCMAACPYGARSFNWRDPRPFIKELNPEFPTRMKGVVEKCTFCYERLAVGKMPICVEESGGAIIFGDIENPNSEVRKILGSNYSIRRKPELGTKPSVYYIIGGGN